MTTGTSNIWCSNCGHLVSFLLPVEPLYSPEVAGALVPMTPKTVMRTLQKHRAELPAPYYRVWRRRRYRLISAPEIRFLRDLVVKRELRRPRATSQGLTPVTGP